jgi:hypothetical protein
MLRNSSHVTYPKNSREETEMMMQGQGRLANYKGRTFAHALALLACAVTMSSCGQGSVFSPLKITSASVEPNPIPAPTAGNPSKFNVVWTVKGSDRHSMLVTVTLPPEALFGQLTGGTCSECENKTVSVSCTSILSSTGDARRELNCDSRLAPLRVAIGSSEWILFAQLPGSGLGLPGENDRQIIQVEVK